MGLEDISGLINDVMKESGMIQSLMGLDSINGQMAKSIRDSILKIRKKDLEYISCRMGEYIEDGGSMENNMDWDHSRSLIVK
jgi:hypothetical protein